MSDSEFDGEMTFIFNRDDWQNYDPDVDTDATTWSQLTSEQQQFLTDTLGATDIETMVNQYSLEYIQNMLPEDSQIGGIED